MIGAAMAIVSILDNPEPKEQNSLAPPPLVELPPTLLREVAGGDIGSGLINVPK